MLNNQNIVRDIIESAKGKFFSVTFKKVDGTMRTMTCRRGVSKGVKGTGKNDRVQEDISNGVLTVFDVNVNNGDDTRGAFRRINLDTIQSMQVQGTVMKRIKDQFQIG